MNTVEEYPLTKEERKTLYFVAMGESNWGIALRLDVSPAVIKYCVLAVRRKLHVTDRTAAAVCAVKRVLFD